LSEASFLPRRTIAGKSRKEKQGASFFSSFSWTSKKRTHQFWRVPFFGSFAFASKKWTNSLSQPLPL